MAVFDFPFHTVEGVNPESDTVVQFGGSYVFTAPASDPDQRTFNLRFAAMKYYLDLSGNISSTEQAQTNMKALLNFYYEHRLSKSFQYQHPVHGMMEVRFAKPCPDPEGIVGGGGAVKSFEVNLIEVP